MIIFVPLDRITANPWQTRQGEPDPEYVKELAMDIAANGLLQKPLGRMVVSEETDLADEMYKFDNWGSIEAMAPGVTVQLAFGHNRLAAYKFLADIKDHTTIVESYTSLPVEIRRLDNQQMADFAWSENERRRDVNSMERAIAIRKRMNDFSWTQQTASEHLGMSRSAIANILRLLDLPEDVQENVLAGQLSERSALALLPLYDLPNSLINKAEASNYYNGKPSEIISMAMQGASSDKIRQAIDMLIDFQSKDLKKVDFLDKEFDVTGYIASVCCRDCEWRIKQRNRCTDPDCFQAKKDHHKQELLYQASKATGIKVSDKVEYEYGDQMTSFRYGRRDSSDAVEKTVKSGCENLRLCISPYGIDESDPCAVQGFKDVMIICQKKSGHCTCLQGAEKMSAYDGMKSAGINAPEIGGDVKADAEGGQDVCTQTYQPATAEQLQEIAKRAKHQAKKEAEIARDVKHDAAQKMIDAFMSHEPKAVRLIYDFLYKGTLWENRPDDLKKIYEGIALKLIDDAFGYIIDSQVPVKMNDWLFKNGIADQTGDPRLLINIFGNDSEG